MASQNAIAAIQAMADVVHQNQDCVLEIIIGENGMVAHLIPMELWEEEDDEE